MQIEQPMRTVYAREWARKRRAQLKAAGLCIDCRVTPVAKGRASCGACLDKNAQKNRAKVVKLKARKKCVACTSSDARPNRIYCEPCAIKHITKQRPLKLQRQAERVAAALCVRCGKESELRSLRADAKQRLCEKCYLMHFASHNLGNSKHWEALKAKLVSQNFKCAYTGIKLVLGVNASVDHILPVSRFPESKHDLDNVEWVDLKVNQMKRDSTRTEFLQLVASIAALQR